MLRDALCAMIAVVVAGCGGDCNGPIPSADSCTEPGVGAASSLELGQVRNGSFVALDDREIVPLVYGTQGGSMITVALRLRGDVPACLEQRTEAFAIGAADPFETDSVPRRTYDEADGSRTTKEMFLILSYDLYPGAMVRLVTEAGGQTAERSVYLEFEGPDAGTPDAGTPDADTTDAGASDADAAMLDAG